MKDLTKCVNEIRENLQRYQKKGLNELSTRTIFIDPLLGALGWDVRDPDEVELEHPTVDGKAVDYAMKINDRVVLHLEAKQLGDPLDDVKSITQVVAYATNDGIEWCVLTNGIRYQVFKASEKASAPEKLLFEVTLDPDDESGLPAEQLAKKLARLSRDSIAEGVLDKLGSEIFTTSKVRKGLHRLFSEKPSALIRLIRKRIADNSIAPSQVKEALGRIWDAGRSKSSLTPVKVGQPSLKKFGPAEGKADYDESHHTKGKPTEVIELYRGLDRLCQEFAPGRVTCKFKAKSINWLFDDTIFCCAHLQQGGLRVWVKIDPQTLNPSITFARDVSRIGHWGVGDVELKIDSSEKLVESEALIRGSFEGATQANVRAGRQ